MVRERVGDWRLAWRFALAGVVAGLLVTLLIQTGITSSTFDAGQDQLFPAPLPDSRITLVALDQVSADRLGGYPLVNNDYHAIVINYLMSLNPKVVLFDIPLSVETGVDSEVPAETDTNIKLVAAITAAAGKIVLVCTADQHPDHRFEVGELVGDRSLGTPDAANAVRAVALKSSQTCSENEAQEPAFLQALRISEGIFTPLVMKGGQAQFGHHQIPLVGNQMLINFTRGLGQTCTYGQIFLSGCPHPDLITNHIVVVGTKLIDGGEV
jgi:CHASE2 domain-containing sensor protein